MIINARVINLNFHAVTDYEDLQARKSVREDAWSRPGWDDIVAYTGLGSVSSTFSLISNRYFLFLISAIDQRDALEMDGRK